MKKLIFVLFLLSFYCLCAGVINNENQNALNGNIFHPINQNRDPIELTSFIAVATAQGFVQIQWTTESETNNLGFNLLRSGDSNINNTIQVNASIISGTNTSTTHSYNFSDVEVEPGNTYYYWLEAIDLSGTSMFWGPVDVTIVAPPPPPSVYLSAYTAEVNEENQVNIQWITSSENNVLGFKILRSSNNIMESGIQVNPEIIPATNTNEPHIYNFTDTGISTNILYRYWLLAITSDSVSMLTGVILVFDNGTAPPPVDLATYTVILYEMEAVIHWVTNNESDMLGYNIYRSEDPSINNAYRMNDQIIPAVNISTTQSYSFVDSDLYENANFYYWLQMVKTDGSCYINDYVLISTGIDDIPIPTDPNATALKNAYPNPFHLNNSTNIMCNVKNTEKANLSIFNIKGQLVKKYDLHAGLNQLIQWDGKDNRGMACSSGIYFCKLSSPSSQMAKKIVLLK
jgi:hypothetical protein